MSRLSNTIALFEQMGDLSRDEAILADIAVSLAQIADALAGTIKIEQMKQAPTYYAYYDPNSPVRGGRGGKE